MTEISMDQLKNIVENMNKRFGLDENHTVVAIFENNENEEIKGWCVVEKGVEADYPMYSTVELFEKYDKTINKEENINENTN